MNQYLIPANTKKGQLIFGLFKPVDLGIFIDKINESKCFNNTIFVFYGDHDARLSKEQFNYYYNFDFNTEVIKINPTNKESETKHKIIPEPIFCPPYFSFLI